MFRRLARISVQPLDLNAGLGHVLFKCSLKHLRLRGLCLRPFAFAVCLCAAVSVSRR